MRPMKCPTCGGKTLVTETRQWRQRVTRHRRCQESECGKTFTTHEMEAGDVMQRDRVIRIVSQELARPETMAWAKRIQARSARQPLGGTGDRS